MIHNEICQVEGGNLKSKNNKQNSPLILTASGNLRLSGEHRVETYDIEVRT